MTKTLTILCALLGVLLFTIPASAQSKAELQQRFKKRLAKIDEFKTQGIIGETSDGYLEFVKGSDTDAAKIMDEENADRKTLYGLIAKETSTSIDVVAQRAAKRNFEKAPAGVFLKEDGKWRKK